MDILNTLNENQRLAVTTTNGPLLIFAGAGSGKTRVITYRIAYLIKEKKIPPYKIMAVTFTNKAAEEMRKRISNLIGPAGDQVFIKTFHSASLFMLRLYGDLIGIPKNFSIYDSHDQETVIKEILIDMRLDPKKIKPSSIASKISEIKDKSDFLSTKDITALIPDQFTFNFHELFDEYQKRLKQHNALDFNDLLVKTVELLRNPDILDKLQERWHYFMIDEYQDTNFSQYLICKQLARKYRNICVVGDDDQSIYSWRGADIRNILNFEQDYPESTVVTLGENYRSTESILAAAASVIKNNSERRPKKLISFRGEGEPVIVCTTGNEYSEAEFVTTKITSFKIKENLKNNSFAILYRTNAQSRVFEELLRRENIPYKIVGGLKFYDRKEIKDIVSYLRFIINPNDTVSLFRIINSPARGIGSATVEKIRNAAYENNISEWDVLVKDIPLEGKKPKGLEDFVNMMKSFQDDSARTPSLIKLSDLVKKIVVGSGYIKNLEDDNDLESRSRLENIDEFFNSIFEFEANHPEATLDEFLQDISLLTTEENPIKDGLDPNDVVCLMTIHNAKGLEFPVIFLTGMEEGLLPHSNSAESETGLEEERRLCYVAITRGMDRVFITNAELRRSYDGVIGKYPSRFLDELPEEHIKRVEFGGSYNGYSQSNYSGTNNGNSYNNSYKSKTSTVRKEQETKAELNDSFASAKTGSGSKFKKHDRVMHPKYGAGLILNIDGSGDNVKLTIKFSTGNKVFLEKYTPLERL